MARRSVRLVIDEIRESALNQAFTFHSSLLVKGTKGKGLNPVATPNSNGFEAGFTYWPSPSPLRRSKPPPNEVRRDTFAQ